MKKYSFVLVFTLSVSVFLNCSSQKIPAKNGDLIFQDLDCPLCEAIEQATWGYLNKPVSHMGIIVQTDSGKYVLEAYDKVRLTPLDTFLKRSNKIMIGRLDKDYRKYIPKAIENGLKKLDMPYDEEFKMDNGKYYCSELIYDIFQEAGTGIFKVYPMNFKNLRTQQYDTVWVNYFKKLNKKIPQGKTGCNPAEYSRNPNLKIIYSGY